MNLSTLKLFASMLKNIRSESLNRDMIGFTLVEDIKPVACEDILAFAGATNDANPIYAWPDPPLPPLFISKLIMPPDSYVVKSSRTPSLSGFGLSTVSSGSRIHHGEVGTFSYLSGATT